MAEIAYSETSQNLEQSSTLNYIIMEGNAKDRLSHIASDSIELIVTSPPYGSIKRYSNNPDEIGWDQSFHEYHESLMEVFKECFRVLHPGCRLVINIGDEFKKTTKSRPYHILPHSSYIVSNLLDEFENKLNYCGDILWHKVSTSNTSGGGKIMGSVYHPRNGHFFVNYEHILVFKKLGKGPKPVLKLKEESRFSLEERREWFRDLWEIVPQRQTEHVAMFPLEIPERIIRMYSFVGETVLDPFLGSGTTLAAAAKNNRSGIGIDIGFTKDDTWKNIVMSKISPYLRNNAILEFVG